MSPPRRPAVIAMQQPAASVPSRKLRASHALSPAARGPCTRFQGRGTGHKGTCGGRERSRPRRWIMASGGRSGQISRRHFMAALGSGAAVLAGIALRARAVGPDGGPAEGAVRRAERRGGRRPRGRVERDRSPGPDARRVVDHERFVDARRLMGRPRCPRPASPPRPSSPICPRAPTSSTGSPSRTSATCRAPASRSPGGSGRRRPRRATSRSRGRGTPPARDGASTSSGAG